MEGLKRSSAASMLRQQTSGNAYAYNEHSAPRVLKSERSRITVRPGRFKPTLEDIAIVPNPYKAVSDYEVTNLGDVVRITNLPEEVDIRVFNLSGTLVREITKRGPERRSIGIS